MAITYLLRGSKTVKKVYVHVSKGRNDLKVVRPIPKMEIDENNWDKETKRATLSADDKKLSIALRTKKQFEIDKFNIALSNFNEALTEQFHALEKAGELTESKISNFIAGKREKELPTKFTDFVDYYIEKRIGLTDGTIKVYNRTKNRVNEKFPKLRMQDIDDNFKKAFAKHFDDNQYQRSYLRKTLKNIRDFWKFAKSKKVNVSDDPLFWQISKEFPDKTVSPDDVYLTLEELEEIKKPELSDYLDNARDWLLISCWTSLRISDFMDLKTDKIFEKDGQKYIILLPKKTQSTKKELSIPLFKEVERILEKRGGQFPRAISHPKYNEYIKTVCEKAKLKELVKGTKKRQKTVVNNKTVYRNETGYFEKWELVTSHIGRRSFVSNFLRQIDAEKIKKITGHSTDSLIDLYNKATALERAEELREDYREAGIE